MNTLVVRKSSIRDVKNSGPCTIIMPSNIYECTLGTDCFIGPFCEIQKGVVIGSRTRIQSHSFICELVTVGDDCMIAHGVCFINDTFAHKGGPARGKKELWKETVVGDRVSIGSNATILPVHICSDVVIGAGAVVTKHITESGIYAGNPARFIRALPSEAHKYGE